MPDEPIRPFRSNPDTCGICGGRMIESPGGSRKCYGCGSTVSVAPDLSERPKTSWDAIKKEQPQWPVTKEDMAKRYGEGDTFDERQRNLKKKK